LRYKCANCSNYDLCEKCEALQYENEFHPNDHLFLKIYRPLPNYPTCTLPNLYAVEHVLQRQDSSTSVNADGTVNDRLENVEKRLQDVISLVSSRNYHEKRGKRKEDKLKKQNWRQCKYAKDLYSEDDSCGRSQDKLNQVSENRQKQEEEIKRKQEEEQVKQAKMIEETKIQEDALKKLQAQLNLEAELKRKQEEEKELKIKMEEEAKELKRKQEEEEERIREEESKRLEEENFKRGEENKNCPTNRT